MNPSSSLEQRSILIFHMQNSSRKGNLANSGFVLEGGKEIAKAFSWPVELVHLSQYEEEFARVFESEMKALLK